MILSNLIYILIILINYSLTVIDCNENLIVEEANWTVHYGEQSKLIETKNYPKAGPPPNLHQIWNVRTASPEHKVAIVCKDLRTSKIDPCTDENSLIIIDSDNHQYICGSAIDFEYVSKGPQLTLGYKTDKWYGGGFMSCRVLAVTGKVMVYPDPEEDELDSSEFGVNAGKNQPSCPCGWTNKIKSRVAHGKETIINEYPFMTGIVQRGSVRPFCGGSIISEFHVLTAAHCVYRKALQNQLIDVRVGEHDWLQESETNVTRSIGVRQIICHENYNPNTHAFDISVLSLENRVPIGQLIGPVCLPTKRLDLIGNAVKTIGWGAIDSSGSAFSELQKGSVFVVVDEKCSHTLGWNNILKSQLCIYGKLTNFCPGDSGGPVIWRDPKTNRYTLIGMPNLGIDCGGPKTTMVTEVSAFIDWIQKHVKGTNSQGTTCGFYE